MKTLSLIALLAATTPACASDSHSPEQGRSDYAPVTVAPIAAPKPIVKPPVIVPPVVVPPVAGTKPPPGPVTITIPAVSSPCQSSKCSPEGGTPAYTYVGFAATPGCNAECGSYNFHIYYDPNYYNGYSRANSITELRSYFDVLLRMHPHSDPNWYSALLARRAYRDANVPLFDNKNHTLRQIGEFLHIIAPGAALP